MDPLTFALGLRDKGLELTLRRRGRLHVWPAKFYKRLTTAERDYINAHRAELRELVAAGLQPRLPDDFVPDSLPTPTPTPERQTPPCPFCAQTPCIGSAHHAYAVLHATDPVEIDRRRHEATAEMITSLRRFGPARY